MFRNLLIIVLAAIILIMAKFGAKAPDGLPIVKTKIDTLRKDSLIVKWKKGADILHDTTIFDTIPVLQPADTLAILQDFFAKNVYKDTLFIPEGYVSIIDTISNNKIQGRQYNAKITQITIRETKEITYPEKKRAGLYIGALGLQNQDKTLGVGAGIIYKTPNKGIFQLNYTNTNQFQFGYYFKIF